MAIDEAFENRPGIPMESDPHPLPGTHWQSPERQQPHVRVFKRASLKELTPVFGTACPPRGLSGVLRRQAYKIPEHKPAHWLLLLFSDRVDVAEGLFIDSFTRAPYVGIIATFSALALLSARRKS